MGIKCCHDVESKKGNMDLLAGNPKATTLGDDDGGDMGRFNSEAEELRENSIANPIVKFQTHKRSEKPQAIRLETLPVPGPRSKRNNRLMIKLNTEANIVECGEKERQMSLELRDSINCTFLDHLEPAPEIRRKESSEVGAGKTSSGDFFKLWKADARAETEIVISLEKRMVVCPAPSHFRRENKNVMEDKYEMLESIGKGAFGEVMKVKERLTGQIRAVKVMPKTTCQMTSNFVDEIKILQKLDHPNVLRFYEFYQDDLRYYLITEYCSGGDLARRIEEDMHYSETQVARLMRQVFAAVEYCHKLGVVHRDLKPGNIVFTGENILSTLKVIDFGRSRLMSQKQELKELAGTLYYMAPEVLDSRPYTEKCDIWSCGVLMYHLLSGFPPFDGHTREQIINAARAGKVEFFHPNWRNVSPEAKKFVLNLLTYEPEKRMSAAKALKHPWILKSAAPETVSSEDLCNIISNLRNFKVQPVFRQAVLSYLASQQMRCEEENDISKFFSYLDYDKDGRLSKQDLAHGLTRICPSKRSVNHEVELIMKNVDVNHSMLIEYNEFLVANLHIDNAITHENLRQAFDFFDEDKKKFIDMADLRRVFGSNCSATVLDRIMQETDTDNDKRITFDDFQKMMLEYKAHKPGFVVSKTQSLIHLFERPNKPVLSPL